MAIAIDVKLVKVLHYLLPKNKRFYIKTGFSGFGELISPLLPPINATPGRVAIAT